MQDETYTFIQTVRDRKAVAHSARYKKNGSKSRKCTLPSDYLTPAEKRRRNSAVQAYTMNEPHTKKELNTWPEDLQREYIKGIIDQFHPSNKDLGLMLGTAETTTCMYVRKLGLKNPIRPTPGERENFIRFRKATKDQSSQLDDGIVVTNEKDLRELLEVKPWEQVLEKARERDRLAEEGIKATVLTYDTISLSFTGTADDLIRVIQTGPIHLTTGHTYTFTISAVRKEAD